MQNVKFLEFNIRHYFKKIFWPSWHWEFLIVHLSCHSPLISFHLYASLPSNFYFIAVHFNPTRIIIQPHSLIPTSLPRYSQRRCFHSYEEYSGQLHTYTCILTIVNVQEIISKWNVKASWIFFLEIMWIKILLSIGQYFLIQILLWHFSNTQKIWRLLLFPLYYNHYFHKI